MPPRRSLPPDAELAVKGHVEPVLINGGQAIKSLSAVFLAVLELHWRVHGPKVLGVLAEKYPQAYFDGMVALSKVIRWDVGEARAYDIAESVPPITNVPPASRWGAIAIPPRSTSSVPPLKTAVLFATPPLSPSLGAPWQVAVGC
jgi:hypothetical protein